MPDFVWTPSEEVIARARLTEFLRFVGEPGFEGLCARSIVDPAWFTDQVIRFLRIPFERRYDQVLDLSRGPEWPRWCVGARMNIARACLQHDASAPAVIAETETGERREMTYGELATEVGRFAGWLREQGVAKGDRVAIYLPLCADVVVALLAIAWIGAIAVPLFSGYGPTAVAARLQQTGTCAVITCAFFSHHGKTVELAKSAREAAARCAPPVRVLELPIPDAVSVPQMEVLEAEEPLLILFSSGTTGEPKGIVHSHCGFPIKAAQDMALHMDIGARDRISWITDPGWMMGPWLVYGALILGATVVLRDGACDWPSSDALWRFTERNRLDVLGISPSLVRRLAEYGDPAATGCDLLSLRFFASSGEPWDPASWDWLFRKVRVEPVPIINYSGGTEISGGILANHPLAPMKPCGFAAACPGMAVDVVDEQGQTCALGTGELALRVPWIGQARGFWKEPERYLESYWSRVPGIWIHGDWVQRDADGHWFVLGRSDDTLKVAGKRVGPAEVEAILCMHSAVVEAAVIGVPHAQKGTALVAFCVAHEQDGLAELLRAHTAKELGKPLQPERICFVDELPKTRNGKTVRRSIRAAYLGEDAGNLSALANPEALEAIRRFNRKEI